MRVTIMGEIGKAIEKEAQDRGLTPAALLNVIAGDWVLLQYKKGKKKSLKPLAVPTVST